MLDTVLPRYMQASHVFWDFDDTLSIHLNWGAVDRHTYIQREFAQDITVFDDTSSVIVPTAYKLFHSNISDGKKHYVYSAVTMKEIAIAKMLWLENKYSQHFEDSLTGTEKGFTLREYCICHNIPVESVLLVDDNVEQRESCKEYGIATIDPLTLFTSFERATINS